LNKPAASSSYCRLKSSTLLGGAHIGGSGVDISYGADDDAT
jgi:hypothetical protein